MTVQYHDPKAMPLTAAEPYNLKCSLGGEIRVALLANGFPDSDAFLEHLQQALADKLPTAAFSHFNKRNASTRVSESMLDEIASGHDVMVAAYGH